MDYINTTPSSLAEEKNRLVNNYATLGEMYVELQKLKANEWANLRELYKSDAQADRAWDRMEPGIKMMEAKQKMKNYLMRISAINTMIRVKDAESRNQY